VAYIRQCLDNFKDNTGVIQLTSAEYTGPLSFVRFWLDNIRDWETENAHHELIGLSTTKDVQDAILADPVRSATVDCIDIRYWYYQEDGKVYAPLGGENLAPRQHERLLKPKRSSFAQVYRAVKEYRTKYPAKAVIYSADGADNFGWAVFMAGGSLADIPVTDIRFLNAATTMSPAGKDYVLAGPNGYIVYATEPTPVDLAPGNYRVHLIHPDGKTEPKTTKQKGGRTVTLDGNTIYWLEKL
jgi:hypothetical protein